MRINLKGNKIMSKRFIRTEGLPNQIRYSSKLECLADGYIEENQKFLSETKINYDKSYKAELTYICKCLRSNTKFVRINYKNGYFFVQNLSIFDKKEGKNASKEEGQYTLSCGVSNVVKYMEKCQKSGVFTKRNFDKIVRDLKACEKGNYRYIAVEKISDSLLDCYLLRLSQDKCKAYLQVIKDYGI